MKPAFFTKDLNELFEILGTDNVRIAGGAVRDFILDLYPKDIDLATTLLPEKVQQLCSEKGLAVIPTGIKHGTVTVLGRKTNEPYEITTLRIDKEQDGRHAKVEFTEDWKLDAARRDITYNAMFMDFEGKIHDYFGGQKDLQNGVTRMVGNAVERFTEDYLRILRLFRFCARFNHKIEAHDFGAVFIAREGLREISGERIWAEMSKILVADGADRSLEIMHETGVGNCIGIFRKIKVDPRIIASGDPIMILASAIEKSDAEIIIEKWKLSNEERDRLLVLIEFSRKSWTDSSAKEFIVRSKKPEWTRDRMIEANFIAGRPSNGLNFWKIPTFPVSGQDFIDLGFKPGPEIGKMVKKAFDLWVAGNYFAEKADLVKKVLD